MASKTVICLLRNDLRYHDNEVLHMATRHGGRVLPLYCLDPRHYKGTWHFDLPKTGPHRLKFLLDSLRDLRDTLQKHGSNLVIRKGKPEEVIPELIGKIGKQNTQAIIFSEECTKEELDVETAVQQCGVPVQTVWGSTLYHREDVPFSAKQVPNVYTEFRKRVEGQGVIRQLMRMPDTLPPLPEGISEGDIPDIKDFGLTAAPVDARTAFPFSGGETTGLARLRHYLWDTDLVATYKETRNGMIGPDFSTKFSPWLAHGCVSPRQIYWEIKRYEKERTNNQSTYWVIFELLWRDYFKFVALKFGDRLFYRSGLLGKEIPWKKDLKAFEAWKDGRTGVPFVDANMRELKETGFMSNRGRQNVASFLTKDLHLDWRLGAEWFESMLIDHDVCSNYGNWLYSAGVGNDPRQDRKFNMVKQGMDYDANGAYVRLWVPELAGLKGGEAHTPWMVSPAALDRAEVRLGDTYPHPMVMAPEWNRGNKRGGGRPGSGRGGGGRPGSARGGGGRGAGPGQKRGMDFYFSSNQK